MGAEREETDIVEPPRFSVRALLWAMALLATAMGNFGADVGLAIVAILVAVYFAAISLDTKESNPLTKRCLLIVAIGSVLGVLFLQAMTSIRTPSIRTLSMNNLKQLVLSCMNYEAAGLYLPSPYSKDELGRPLHSWRTLIQPYLESEDFYKQLSIDKPWDDPENMELFQCDDDHSFLHDIMKSPRYPARYAEDGTAHYLAVVDESTIWSPHEKTSTKDITDGAENTIALIEVASSDIRWYEPRDLTLDEAIDLLVGEGPACSWVVPGYFVSVRMEGDGLRNRCVAFADGLATVLPPLSDREQARALLTKAGGEAMIREDVFKHSELREREERVVGHIIHWHRVLSMALFLVLAVTPFVVLFLSPIKSHPRPSP